MVAEALRVPGYRLGAELGRGGVGVVYAARRLDDGTEWAVKVLRPDLAPRRRESLRTEARRAGRVSHPGVLPVLAAGERDGLSWLVMPKVDGSDLRRLLRERGPLPPDEAAELIGQVAEAVAAVHAAGLVHRDIKPANVLVDGQSRVLLSDLGTAAPLPEAVEESLFSRPAGTGDLDWTGSDPDCAPMAGTLAYMAPEQWRGEPATARSDIYALGGTLYAALTAHRPFEQTGLAALAFAVGSQEPKPPSAFGVPVAFDAVIGTAMAKRPEHRHPDVPAFRAAVRDAAEGLIPATPGARRRAWPRLLVGVGALVLLGALAAVLWWPHTRTAPPSASTANVVSRSVCARHMTLRARPGHGGTVERTLTDGQRLRIDRTRIEGAWSFATTGDGRTGWVLNQYLCH